MRQTRGGIYIPGDGFDVPEDYLDATEEYNEAEAIDQCIDFRRMLKDIDSRLDLVYVKVGAKAWPKDNRWYIIRRSDTGLPANIWVVEDEQGEYCEPDERHLRRLQEMDAAAHPRLWQDIQRRRQEKRIRAELAHEAKREEFRTKLGERLDSVFSSPIAVSGAMKDAFEGKRVKAPPPGPPRKQRKKRNRW